MKGDPDSMMEMPEEITSENGAKYLLTGEFHETVELECGYCDSSGVIDEDENMTCEMCEGVGKYPLKIDVSWSTIKDIYAAIVKGVKEGKIK